MEMLGVLGILGGTVRIGVDQKLIQVLRTLHHNRPVLTLLLYLPQTYFESVMQVSLLLIFILGRRELLE